MSANPTSAQLQTPGGQAPRHRLRRWNGGQAEHADLQAQGAIENGALLLNFRLFWTPDGWPLQLPPSLGCSTNPPRRADGLWQHTCFEAFIASVGSSAYWEFNLSPAGDWNVYRFDDYRTGQRMETAYQCLPLRVSGPQAAPPDAHGLLPEPSALLELDLCCALPPDLRESLPEGTGLELGLTAVLEQRDGELSYWALTHPGPQPDFHDRRGWSLRL